MVEAREVPKLVLAQAGCWPRDRVTLRTFDEVQQKTGKWGRNAAVELSDDWFLEGLSPGKAAVDADDDGLPDAWEKEHGLDPRNANDNGKIVPKGASKDDRHLGYSFLEFYINELADALLK